MTPFHELLRNVCKRPGMYVGGKDFALVCAFLRGYDHALYDLRPDSRESGLHGFREWLAVRLDSCAKSDWSEIIVREDTGDDKFEALDRLYGKFARERSEGGLEAVMVAFERVGWSGDRTCWCELSSEERVHWKPGYRRS